MKRNESVGLPKTRPLHPKPKPRPFPPLRTLQVSAGGPMGPQPKGSIRACCCPAGAHGASPPIGSPPPHRWVGSGPLGATARRQLGWRQVQSRPPHVRRRRWPPGRMPSARFKLLCGPSVSQALQLRGRLPSSTSAGSYAGAPEADPYCLSFFQGRGVRGGQRREERGVQSPDDLFMRPSVELPRTKDHVPGVPGRPDVLTSDCCASPHPVLQARLVRKKIADRGARIKLVWSNQSRPGSAEKRA